MNAKILVLLRPASASRLSRGTVPILTLGIFYVLPHRNSIHETSASVSVSHIIVSSTQPEWKERPEWESNPRPPDGNLRALPTDLTALHPHSHPGPDG